MIRAEGPDLFRSRLASSVLSNRPLIIEKIREADQNPGVTDYEVCFAQLVDKLTNGTSLTINPTGTSVTIRPGYILGGAVEHECVGRSIGYYLEGVIPLCLFAKTPVKLTFIGVTDDDLDIGSDILKMVTCRLIKRFGLETPPQVTILQRAAAPGGKGKMVFTCPIARELKPIQILDPGLVRKVRGVAYALRVSPQFANRMATSSRGVLNDFIPDVYINTDHVRASDLPSGPGYGVTLYSESTTGCVLGTKRVAIRQSSLKENEPGNLVDDWSNTSHPGVKSLHDPEALGENTSYQLLEEIEKGGCIDASHQALMFTLMTLCSEDVSKIRVGKLTNYSVRYLGMLRDFFGIMFKIKVDEETDTVVCSCVGVGYKNLARKVT
mmetsp:Transcript_44224/g.70683  ORF Transcript_44224/g.70683 Transcript_44224/m.70683 type:complete len:381 (+) Transcript_44224:73-1215(+)